MALLILLPAVLVAAGVARLVLRDARGVKEAQSTVRRSDPGSDGRTGWTFGDGSVWHVRQHPRVPTRLRRCIVFRATEIPDGMGVAVSTPRSCSEGMLAIWDAEELTPDLRTEPVG